MMTSSSPPISTAPQLLYPDGGGMVPNKSRKNLCKRARRCTSRRYKGPAFSFLNYFPRGGQSTTKVC